MGYRFSQTRAFHHATGVFDTASDSTPDTLLIRLQHLLELAVDSEAGKGTTFTLRLPRGARPE
jgi:hypothetical protein